MTIRGLNKVQLLGFVGNDVTILPPGENHIAVTAFSVATSESWSDAQTGEVKEHTEWHRVVVFGNLAVDAAYLNRGSLVYIEGENRTRECADDTGFTRRTTEVVVRQNGTMQMVNLDSSDLPFPHP